MCYFEMTVWTCGFWRWGHFRQQCNKEYRMGETCGLKLVYDTKREHDVCRLCHDIEKKQRRFDKMSRDIERWQREGNRTATIERTSSDMREVADQIYRMKEEHYARTSSLGQIPSNVDKISRAIDYQVWREEEANVAETSMAIEYPARREEEINVIEMSRLVEYPVSRTAENYWRREENDCDSIFSKSSAKSIYL